MSGPSITVDHDKCIGSGNCEFRAPSTFRLDDGDGLSRVVDPAGDPLEEIKAAAYECPMAAIAVGDDYGRVTE